MKSILIILAFFFSFLYQALAASLTIETPFAVKVEEYAQFRAYLTSTEGARTEVTNQVHFSMIGARDMGAGQFLVELPPFNSGNDFYLNISASYNTPAGESLSAFQMVRVDVTPQYLELWGSPWARAGQSSTFRAYGHYGIKRVDLTQNGRWYALYGQMGSWGYYQAPMARDGRTIYDRISFSFGMQTSSISVTVQP